MPTWPLLGSCDNWRMDHLFSGQLILFLIKKTLAGEEEANSSEQLTAVISSGRIYQNVGRFKLIWWDKGSRSRHGFSIWRPNVPPGCAMLGDVAMKG